MSRPFLFRSPRRRRAEPAAPSLGDALADRRAHALPPALEARFEADTRDDQARALSRAALGTALVYCAQLVAEASLTPDVFGLTAALHFGVVTPALLLIAAFARAADTPMRRDLMGAAIPLLIAAQVAATAFATAAPGAPYYFGVLGVIAALANASLPLSMRASTWSTTLCLTLLALCAQAPHLHDPHVGRLIPVSLCALVTLHSVFQRNRDARRVYVADLRHRLHAAEVGQEARLDPLTQLANRRKLDEAAERLWAAPSACASPVSVILFDVDRFKAFNDLYGHQAGDDALRQVAACAAREIAAPDEVAARYGGEEFMLLLPRTSHEEAMRVAERLRAAVAALGVPHAGAEETGVVTASFGVATADAARCGFEALTTQADGALYLAKRSGRNRVATEAPTVKAA